MTITPGRRADSVCRFGPFELDRRTLELWKSGERIKLAPQPARMLVLLACRPGELVTRDDIRRELWGEETFVDFDRNLNYCLTCIRHVLGDTARSPRFIETLPRRGYRFIAPVEGEPAVGSSLPAAGVEGAPAPPEVIETFLKAMAGIGRQSAEGLVEALGHFREITTRAPDFAPGLSGYASCLFSLGWWGHAPAGEVYPTARVMLEQAVAIDDELGSAHSMLGFLIWLLDWDLSAAEGEFLRAIELGPTNPEARIFYAIFLCGVGRHSESLASAEYGLGLNPTSLLANQAAAWNYVHNGCPERAEALARRTLERFPGALQPHLVLGWAAWSQGRPSEAVAVFEKALALSREALTVSFLGHVYARVGRREEARRLLGELDQLASQGKASPMAHVVLLAGLDDLEAAFEWIERAFRLRHDLAWFFTRFPGLDPLRSDLRFAALEHPTPGA